jgi:2'-5' RNA ligase
MKFRAFIAVEVGPLPALLDIEERLRATRADIKLVEPENIHVTLKFLGDTDEDLVDKIEDVMKASTAGVGPFTIKLENMGAFPKLDYMRVVWVGMSGAESLVQIAKALNNGLKPMGFKSDKKGFKPHLTIARVRSPRNKSELRRAIDAQIDDQFGEVHVDKIVLKKSVLSSQGPTYSDVRVVPLEGGE